MLPTYILPRRRRGYHLAQLKLLDSLISWLARLRGRALLASLTEPLKIPHAGYAARPSGHDPSRTWCGAPRRGAVVPARAHRRRYARAPAVALLTDLGTGELAR